MRNLRNSHSRTLRISPPEKFLLIPLVVLAVFLLFIPFLIQEHTIETTKYIYLGMVTFVFGMWLIDYLLVNNNHRKVFDWAMTILILCISPVLVIIGLFALLIIALIPKTAYFIVWILALVVVFLLGVRIKPIGSMSKNYKPSVVVMNHTSFLDYFLVAVIMGYKQKWKVVYGTNLHKYPILRYFLKRYGIGVDRKNSESKRAASEAIKRALKDGFWVPIFPEGTRMRSKQMNQILLPFHNGAFSAATESKRPIIPIALSWPILYSRPDRPLPLSPRRIMVGYGNPIYSENETAQVLKEQTYSWMMDMLIKIK